MSKNIITQKQTIHKRGDVTTVATPAGDAQAATLVAPVEVSEYAELWRVRLPDGRTFEEIIARGGLCLG